MDLDDLLAPYKGFDPSLQVRRTRGLRRRVLPLPEAWDDYDYVQGQPA